MSKVMWISIGLLAGCAHTAADISAEGKETTGTSPLPPQQLASCFVANHESTTGSHVGQIRNGIDAGGIDVHLRNSARVIGVARIRPDGNGSAWTIRYLDWPFVEILRQKTVEGC